MHMCDVSRRIRTSDLAFAKRHQISCQPTNVKSGPLAAGRLCLSCAADSPVVRIDGIEWRVYDPCQLDATGQSTC